MRCIRIRLLFAAAALVLVTGCGGPVPLEAPPGAPLVIGPVESLSHHATGSSLLVRAGPGSREACGISATADADTRYYRRDAAGSLHRATIAELAVGDTVEIFVDGPVAESCPVQGRASAVVIRGEPAASTAR